MKRTARLYALVEELRAAAPRPLTVAALAARFEISTRTVQRDLQMLMEAGVPVRTAPGRGGGWCIDPQMTMPPIRFAADEAAALAAAGSSTPFADAARTAAQKITASMTGPASTAAQALAARIVALPSRADSTIRAAVEYALSTRTVLRLSYVDAAGRTSERAVEPAGLLTADGHWYLIAWCRTRRAGRGFRLDRITTAAVSDEPAQPRDLAELLHGSAGAGAVPAMAPAPPPHERGAPSAGPAQEREPGLRRC
ncbi:WYL domain-containing protein [Streptomyces sp. ITFR-16]|uniref:helix-turn-helix transcriptional regulator n=1 Tax=Streptomyces sp. ITFR-16 TaxID=3075198 RepID=UPI00288B7895|nr:WYL domain-containing protein [Streptomyces sp. ITFR-16]WNI24584.1 WYL domain-containing protein [Streptomyces sp. ITFR-16]